MKFVSNKLLLPSLVFFFSFKVFANTAMPGFLQAYWMPVWEDNNNDPALMFRFFEVNDTNKVVKVINLSGSSLNEKLVNEKFYNIPKEFFKFHEGYVNQYGKLDYGSISVYEECDNKIFNAKLIAFTPFRNPPDINPDEKGCDSYPYLLTYQLKDGVNKIYLKSKPIADASNLVEILSGNSLVKIKTLDNGWYYVANYDESKPGAIGVSKGYVKADELAPVN